MSKKLPFTFTDRQKQAVKRYVLAKAFNDMIQPQFKRMEKELLETGNYKIDDSYYSNERFNVLNLPADRIMRDTQTIYMIDGHQEKEVSRDALRFYSDMRYMALAEGFQDGENTACKADHELIKATRHLIEETATITNMTQETIDRIAGTENWYKLLDLTLRLLMPLIPDSELKAPMEQYFADRMAGKPIEG